MIGGVDTGFQGDSTNGHGVGVLGGAVALPGQGQFLTWTGRRSTISKLLRQGTSRAGWQTFNGVIITSGEITGILQLHRGISIGVAGRGGAAVAQVELARLHLVEAGRGTGDRLA